VSRPLAAHTFAAADGNWTFSFAALESNTNHNGVLFCGVYVWRPSTGAVVGSNGVNIMGKSLTATGQTAYSDATHAWGASASVTCQDGDILVFDVQDVFTQSMSSAYTSSFAYNGTTEASTTSCASFVTPPAPLTLFTASAAASLVARPRRTLLATR
jgi:hypothetical protein